MKRKPVRMRSVYRHHGLVLLITLVLLLVVTLIATAGMRSTILNQRMSSGLADGRLAFEAAEAALSEAEAWLGNIHARPVPVTSNTDAVDVWPHGLVEAPGAMDWYLDAGDQWWGSEGKAEMTLENFPLVNDRPRFLIEELAVNQTQRNVTIGSGEQSPDRVVYRITARGTGSGSVSVIYLQSTYSRQYP